MERIGRESGAEFRELDQPLDLRIARVADSQHGVVSLSHLRTLGLSDESAWKRAAAGRLHRVHRSVYAVGRAFLDASGRRMAAVLACGCGAALSPIARARTRCGSCVLRARGSRCRSRRGRAGSGADHHPSLVHAASRGPHVDPRYPVHHRLENAARPGRCRERRAARRRDRGRGADAAARPTAAGKGARERAGSPGGGPAPSGARRLHRRPAATDPEGARAQGVQPVRRGGLPKPAVDVLVHTAAETLEVDFCWADRRLIVEADSFEFHRSRRAFEADRRRDQLLRARGWTTVRITWRQLNERPDEVLAAVA